MDAFRSWRGGLGCGFGGQRGELGLDASEVFLGVGVGAIPLALAYRWTDRARGHVILWFVGVPLLVAGLWTVRELVMGSWPYSGFPWARIGMTQANGPLPEIGRASCRERVCQYV